MIAAIYARKPARRGRRRRLEELMARRGNGIYLCLRTSSLITVTIAALAGMVMPAHGQTRLDAVGMQACTSLGQLISDLQSRMVTTAQARQRLMGIYDMARTSSAPSVRQIASIQSGQVASADDTQLLVMAEQFAATACR
jgi:hypothetical protein